MITTALSMLLHRRRSPLPINSTVEPWSSLCGTHQHVLSRPFMRTHVKPMFIGRCTVAHVLLANQTCSNSAVASVSAPWIRCAIAAGMVKAKGVLRTDMPREVLRARRVYQGFFDNAAEHGNHTPLTNVNMSCVGCKSGDGSDMIACPLCLTVWHRSCQNSCMGLIANIIEGKRSVGEGYNICIEQGMKQWRALTVAQLLRLDCCMKQSHAMPDCPSCQRSSTVICNS